MDMEHVHASKRFRALSGSGAGGVTAAGQPASAAKVIRSQRRQLQDDETTAHGGVVKSRVGKGAMADAAALRPQWQQPSSAASRICRVSRATGGKDRHSKVFTAKGLRDRRVRLSVSTAIQFYDLQDRLGYDQPSKAVEWLIKAATAAIADLPSLDGVFPGEGNPPVTQMAEEQEDAEVDEIEQADNPQRPEQQQQQHVSLTKSACSSTSETSRGSVLSLSRPDNRIKARERGRERTATAKEKEEDNSRDHESAAQFASVEEHHHQSLNLHPSSQSSFIELLTCGSQQNQSHTHSPVANLIPKQLRHSPTSPATVKADFFGQVGLFAEGEKPHQPPGFPSTQTHFNIAAAAAASASRDHPEMQQQQQQFSFMPDHLIPLAVSAAGGDYINFSVSSGIAGFNRGTLQSNFAPPQPNHHPQRLSSPVDGSNLPFFLSAAAAQAASAPWEGPFPAGFDSRLQLCYDGYRHSDLKDKGKN